ncbi:MAG: peptidoglycan bridge formation glycyltransferase FemA/FemB family protein [Longilinea sp.]|jgi:lipid II:glycine glycyltransferase (peptidoglycan interpeptide bridge formation enzyme)|nr:peptidoglycan bridge formation glycyltransferase FemA/FemB family protein [Longilinea sp.]
MPMELAAWKNWDESIAALPSAHILQTRAWAEVKRTYGWTPYPYLWRTPAGKVCAAALVLQRSLRLGVNILYVPRGPLLDWSQPDLVAAVIADLEKIARTRHSIFIKIDPEAILGTGIPGAPDAVEHPSGLAAQLLLQSRDWLPSDEQIQFRNTVMLDLQSTESAWLERMKPKTRYNLRLAERKGVQVRAGAPADFPLLYRMYAETSIRDGFVIRPQSYYAHVWQTFMDAGLAVPLIAEVDSRPIAAVFLFWFAGRAWYLYGMSTADHRDKMPNYALQWEAMRLASSKGCHLYDLWGAPDVFDETDSMWGVFRFKEGLGGQVIRTIGAWDYPVNRGIYRLYLNVLPRLLNWMRRRGKAQTQREVSL